MTRTLKNFFIPAFSILLISVTVAQNADANSLVSSNPSNASVISTAPSTISITVSNPISDSMSEASVLDPNGNRIDDGTLIISGTTAVLGLKVLTMVGNYTVKYKILSEGDKPLEGQFIFKFQPIQQTDSVSTTQNQSKKLIIDISSSTQVLTWGRSISLSIATVPKITGECSYNIPVMGGYSYLLLAKSKLIKGKAKSTFPVTWKADVGSSQRISITVICGNAQYSGKSGKIFIGYR